MRPSELPVQRLHGLQGGFFLAGNSPPCNQTTVRQRGPLVLPPPQLPGEAPLLLLLENADALPEALLSGLQAILTPGERQALQQRKRQADRSRHGAGLGLVRLVLSALLDHPAAAVPIVRGAQGKPQLGPGPWPPLQFNLAHSGSLLLLGLHRHTPIGVDLERHRQGLRWRPIARRYFTEAAFGAIEALPETQQLQAFTVAWCDLEASLKADGCGLAARARNGANTIESIGRQQLFRPQLPAGYSGAVVLAGASPSP